MAGSGTVFLMYHELELPGRPLCDTDPGYVRYVVRHADFRSQMESLKQAGWEGVTVGEAIDSFPEKSVAITFDDGSETDLITAAPLLSAMKFRGTFFVTTGFLGRRGYLSQAQLRELSDSGFEIGCHSMNHRYLTDLSAGELHREIAEPKKQLEDIIGKAVRHFSCPGGRYDRRVSEIARESGYDTVSTSRIQANSGRSDRFALGRIAIMRSTDSATFDRVYKGQNLWQLQLQVQLANATKKLLGNSTYDRLRAALLR